MNKGIIQFLKEEKLFVGIIAIILLLKIFLINFGNPYLFHPDEPYILKDPFKLLLSYTEGVFSAPTNLFFWVLIIWYAIVFALGYPLGLWNSFLEFKQMLAGEDFTIMCAGRLLSVLFAVFSYIILYQTIKLISKNKTYNIIYIAIIMLNPIDLISTMWLKFDSICLLFFCAIIYFAVKVFYCEEQKYRKHLYALIFLGLSIRVDFISVLATIAIYEMYLKRSLIKYLLSLLEIKKTIAFAVIAYCAITLYPVSIIYNKLNPVNIGNQLKVVKPFEEAVTGLIFKSIYSSVFLHNVLRNIKFYLFNISIVALLPIFVAFIYSILKNAKYYAVFVLFLLIYSIPLLLHSHRTPHYYVFVTIIFFLIPVFQFQKYTAKWVNTFLIISLVYIGSLSLEILFHINFAKDTRIASRDFILQNTSKNEIIAIDGFENYGFYPVINECSDVLNAKIKAIVESHSGTGASFAYKIKRNDDTNCRNIYEISAIDRYKGTDLEKKLINTFDTVALANTKPKIYVLNEFNTVNNVIYAKGYKEFLAYVKRNYTLIKQFEDNDLLDWRIKQFLFTENFSPHFYVYQIN